MGTSDVLMMNGNHEEEGGEKKRIKVNEIIYSNSYTCNYVRSRFPLTSATLSRPSILFFCYFVVFFLAFVQ